MGLARWLLVKVSVVFSDHISGETEEKILPEPAASICLGYFHSCHCRIEKKKDSLIDAAGNLGETDAGL